jgi:hypothetical protein
LLVFFRCATFFFALRRISKSALTRSSPAQNKLIVIMAYRGTNPDRSFTMKFPTANRKPPPASHFDRRRGSVFPTFPAGRSS